MTKLALPATIVALAVLAASPASADDGYERACGDQAEATGAPWTDLEADNVVCRVARKLADVYVSGPYEDDYKNWTCNEKTLGPEELKVKCKRSKNGGQRLRFFYGA